VLIIKLLEIMKNLQTYILITGWAFLMTACVSSKKYQALLQQTQETDLADKGKTMQLEKLRSEMVYLQNQIQQLRTENARLEYQMRHRQDSLNEVAGKWQIEYTRLANEYEQLAKNSSAEANLHRQNLEAKNQEARYLAQQINQIVDNSPKSNPQNQPNPVYTSPQNTTETTNPVNSEKNKQSIDNQVVNNVNANSLETTNNENRFQSTQKLAEQLKNLFENFKDDELKIQTLQNQTLLTLGDEAWFDKSLNLNDLGKKNLEVIADILSNRSDISVFIASETPDTAHEEDSAIKAQKIADNLAKNGLKSALLPKNYSPLAFDTSGTEEKKTRTFIVLKTK
jgi:hypothetical protein